MTTTIIILIIAYVIVSKIMGKDGRKLPSRPTGRPPENIEQPSQGYASPRSEDDPLSGPWDTSPHSGDGPLSGPWDTLPRGDDSPLPGPWRSEHTANEDNPLTPQELGNGPRSPRQQREQTYPVGDPPERFEQTYDRPRQFPAAMVKGDICPVDNVETPLLHRSQAARGRQRRNADNPLGAALQSKNALMASIIIGDVLNSRGGRKKRGLGNVFYKG